MTPTDPAAQLARATDQRLTRSAGRLSTSLQRLRSAAPERSEEIDEVCACFFDYLADKVRVAERAAAAHQRPAGWVK